MGYPVNERLTEGLTVLSAVNTPTVTAAVLSPAIDLAKIRKIVALFTAGTLAAAETVTCKLQGAVTSGGAYTDIPASSFTLVKATDDNKTQVIETNAENLNALGLNYRYVKTSVSASVGSPVCVTVLGGCAVEEPISSNNTANVKALNVV